MGKVDLLNKYQAERTKCLQWSRVMGYYRPSESYNIGKQSEFNERTWFKVGAACGCDK